MYHLDRIDSWAAVALDPATRSQQLVGFVTTREVILREVDPVDRSHMGLTGPHMDNDTATYILTLGVSPAFRRRGIAAELIRLVHAAACRGSGRALFLHVISYNQEAIRLYSRASFSCLGLLKSFYHINTGRQPVQSQVLYDAYLYVLHLPARQALLDPHWPRQMHSPWLPPPLRSAWQQLNSCLAHSGCWSALSMSPASPSGMAHARSSGSGASWQGPALAEGSGFKQHGDSRRRAWAGQAEDVHAGQGSMLQWLFRPQSRV